LQVNTKTGGIEGEVPGSAKKYSVYGIDQIDTMPNHGPVRIEDLGNGQLAVNVQGRFAPGTRVRLGGTILTDAAPNFLLEPWGLRFIAPAIEIARGVQIGTRDGRETELLDILVSPPPDELWKTCSPANTDSITVMNAAQSATRRKELLARFADVEKAIGTGRQVTIRSVTALPINATDSKVVVDFDQTPTPLPGPQNVLIMVGSRIYGLRDAPVARPTAQRIEFTAPTDSLKAARELTGLRLLWGPGYRDTQPIKFDNVAEFAPAKLTIISQGAKIRLALIGSGFKKPKIDLPYTKDPDEKPAVTPTLAVFTFAPDELKGVKQLGIIDGTNPIVLLDVPTTEPKPSLKDHDPIKTGAMSVTLDGTMLNLLDAVVYRAKEDIPIFFKVAADGASVTFTFPAKLTSDPTILTLHCTFKDKTEFDYRLGITP
jgi:hypothetical protein